jgi:hypothetical protein
MLTTDPLVAQIFNYLAEHRGQHYFDCMGVTSPEHHAPVRMHIESQYQKTHVVEYGRCSTCMQDKEIVRHRLSVPDNGEKKAGLARHGLALLRFR